MMLITTLVVSFCKFGGGSVNVKLWLLVVSVRCEVLCRLVVSGNVFLLILIVVILHVGESNGKLPPRTCPGCSVPEPYRSHDWALVPAKPGL